jgi:hypothetical protein
MPDMSTAKSGQVLVRTPNDSNPPILVFFDTPLNA